MLRRLSRLLPRSRPATRPTDDPARAVVYRPREMLEKLDSDPIIDLIFSPIFTLKQDVKKLVQMVLVKRALKKSMSENDKITIVTYTDPSLVATIAAAAAAGKEAAADAIRGSFAATIAAAAAAGKEAAVDAIRANAFLVIPVREDCKTKFMALKTKRTHRFIVFKIDQKQKEVIVESVGERDQTFEDFTACFPADECRYAVFDSDYMTVENVPKSRIVFIGWSPDTASVWEKIIYASSKDMFKRKLDGTDVELQTADPMGLDLLNPIPWSLGRQ